MMGAVTLAAAVFAAFMTDHGVYSGMLLLFLAALFPACLGVGIAYGTRQCRAFCVGALLPATIILQSLFSHMLSIVNEAHWGKAWNTGIFINAITVCQFRSYVVFAWGCSILTGIVTVIFYRITFAGAENGQGGKAEGQGK